MESYQICPQCRKKVIERRSLMILYKAKKIPTKPKKVIFCIACAAYIDMESYFESRRYLISDGWNTGSYTNCIVGCGYGMFAPRFYNKILYI